MSCRLLKVLLARPVEQVLLAHPMSTPIEIPESELFTKLRKLQLVFVTAIILHSGIGVDLGNRRIETRHGFQNDDH